MSKQSAKHAQVINKRYEAECPINSVKPFPGNARRHADAMLDESMSENGFYGALIVQESTGYILVGNGRWRAMKRAGAKTIPVIFVEPSDSNDAIKINVADNRASDLSTYDANDLAALLDTLSADDELFGTGFSSDDLRALLDSLAEDAEGNKRTTDLNDPDGGDVPHGLSVLVECKDEAEQRRAYELLIEAGFTCRILTL